MHRYIHLVELPVKTTLLQNVGSSHNKHSFVELPVKTTLLQNLYPESVPEDWVELPVKTTLLQNNRNAGSTNDRLNYQLKRHCSKTLAWA